MPSPRALLILPVAAAALGLGACDAAFESGERTVEARTVAAFQRIQAQDGIDVRLRAGDERRVRVRAGDEVIGDIQTEVENGTLRIWRDGGDSLFPGSMVVEVDVPSVEAIEASGGSDVDAEDLAGTAFAVSASGGSDVRLAGRVGRLTLEASGGSDADLAALEAREVRLDVSGGADAEVSASERLEASVSGGADVTYHGDPDVVQDVSGSADFGRAG